jgi:hypothetical protein
MASTYSPSLRIELIGAGEQAGTWNTTTNTNLGTLLETAIAGNVTVAVASANQALTASNGVTDQARQAILTLTTSTSAPFAIYAPPQPKQYIIYNTTAYAATIYNSTSIGNTTAAGTPVVIPALSRVIVFSDATNFYSTNISNLTGAVTSLGNVTSLGSFTSSQLLGALTDETGTGVAVFATSPTLITPALGTPTALVGTNITGTAAGLSIGGSAATATTATTATTASALATTGFSIVESGGKLVFKYGATTIASMSSTGVITALSDVTAGGTP